MAKLKTDQPISNVQMLNETQSNNSQLLNRGRYCASVYFNLDKENFFFSYRKWYRQ